MSAGRCRQCERWGTPCRVCRETEREMLDGLAAEAVAEVERFLSEAWQRRRWTRRRREWQ